MGSITPLTIAIDSLECTQRQAVLADPETPLLISAGAGSGKTRVLTLRIATLLERHQVKSEQILALTFTKKACCEMQERVCKLCPQIAKHALSIKTFHSFCLEVVRDHYVRLNFMREPFVLDSVAQAELIKECIELLNPSKKSTIMTSWKPEENMEGVGADDSEAGGDGSGRQAASFAAQNRGLHNAIRYFQGWLSKSAVADMESSVSKQSDEYDQNGGRGWSAQFNETARSVEEELKILYEREKRGKTLVDFDDLIPLAMRLLRRDPYVAQQLKNRFLYILVDEYQDASTIQFELIAALSSNRPCPSITACGDPDQSIYSFINGNAAAQNNFERFMSKWPMTQLIKLSKNFRSQGIVVKAAAALIRNNPETPSSTASHCWTDNPDGSKICICSFASVDREVNWVCDEIQRCKREGVPLRQMAILFRVRRAGMAFQRELQKRKVAVVNNSSQEYGSPYRKALAMDLLAYLKLALTDDDKSVERVLNKPKRGLGEQALEKLRQVQSRFKCSLLQAAKKAARIEVKGYLSAAQQKGVQSFLRLVSDMRDDVANKSAEEVLKSLLDRFLAVKTGSGNSSKKGQDKDDDHLAMSSLMASFIEDLAVTDGLDDDMVPSLAGGSVNGGGSTSRKLSKFVNAVCTMDTEGLKKMRENEVLRLSTIHQAKGLEFSHVWVVQMAEGICPLRPNLDNCQDEEQMEQIRSSLLQEERRLAYVALTRAKSQLCITWVSKDSQTGDHLEPSRFIEEIPEAFKIGAKAAAAARASSSALTSALASDSARHSVTDKPVAHTTSYLSGLCGSSSCEPANAANGLSSSAKSRFSHPRIEGRGMDLNIESRRREIPSGISHPAGARAPIQHAHSDSVEANNSTCKAGGVGDGGITGGNRLSGGGEAATQSGGMLRGLPSSCRSSPWAGSNAPNTTLKSRLQPSSTGISSIPISSPFAGSRGSASTSVTQLTLNPQVGSSSWGARSAGAVLQPWLSGRGMKSGCGGGQPRSINQTPPHSTSRDVPPPVSSADNNMHAIMRSEEGCPPPSPHGNAMLSRPSSLSVQDTMDSQSFASTDSSGLASSRPTLYAGRLEPRFGKPNVVLREEGKSMEAKFVQTGSVVVSGDLASRIMHSWSGKGDMDEGGMIEKGIDVSTGAECVVSSEKRRVAWETSNDTQTAARDSSDNSVSQNGGQGDGGSEMEWVEKSPQTFGFDAGSGRSSFKRPCLVAVNASEILPRPDHDKKGSVNPGSTEEAVDSREGHHVEYGGCGSKTERLVRSGGISDAPKRKLLGFR